ncbi:MAG: hypothetical protein H0W33_02740 [Gammaproteobacteria bacterium]|nr:hypothetical protein [Gammaproteobacteria bacterium]
MNTSIRVVCIIALALFAAPAQRAVAQAEEDFGAAPQEAPAAATAPAQTQSAAPASGVVASTDGEQPGVRAEVTELKRSSGGTVNLKFTLINDSDQPYQMRDLLGGLSYGYNVSGVHLVDAANKKKYQVILDAEKKCLCSDGLNSEIAAKSRINVWAKLPAPPEDVQQVSVIIPHFIPMDDVPIS